MAPTVVSRQALRQAETDNKKHRVQAYWCATTPAGASTNEDMVLVAPPGGPLSPNSKIDPSQMGKIPMLYDKQRGVFFGYDHHARALTKQQAIDGSFAANIGVGLKGPRFPALDIDCSNVDWVKQINEMAIRHLGIGPVRYRDNSPRCLRPYRLKAGEPPMKRQSVIWIDKNGAKHAVELLGAGSFYVCEGIHPSGAPYKWVDNKNVCKWGMNNLCETGAAPLKSFFAELELTIDKFEWGTINTKTDRASGQAAIHKSIDDPSLRAPSPQHVLDLLKVWRNTAENVPTHNDFVRAMAAIVGALGPDREEYYADVEAWALGYEQNTPEYVRARWDSFQ